MKNKKIFLGTMFVVIVLMLTVGIPAQQAHQAQRYSTDEQIEETTTQMIQGPIYNDPDFDCPCGYNYGGNSVGLPTWAAVAICVEAIIAAGFAGSFLTTAAIMAITYMVASGITSFSVILNILLTYMPELPLEFLQNMAHWVVYVIQRCIDILSGGNPPPPGSVSINQIAGLHYTTLQQLLLLSKIC